MSSLRKRRHVVVALTGIAQMVGAMALLLTLCITPTTAAQGPTCPHHRHGDDSCPMKDCPTRAERERTGADGFRLVCPTDDGAAQISQSVRLGLIPLPHPMPGLKPDVPTRRPAVQSELTPVLGVSTPPPQR